MRKIVGDKSLFKMFALNDFLCYTGTNGGNYA